MSRQSVVGSVVFDFAAAPANTRAGVAGAVSQESRTGGLDGGGAGGGEAQVESSSSTAWLSQDAMRGGSLRSV